VVALQADPRRQLKYSGIMTGSASYPGGCFWHALTNSVYFNTDAAGAANEFAQPLCFPCPAGTFSDNSGDDTATFNCSNGCCFCKPGTASKTIAMDRCDACLGPDALAACPGGTASPHTKAQMGVALDLLKSSKVPKPLQGANIGIDPEKQCQPNAPQLLPQVGAVITYDTGLLRDLKSPFVLGLIGPLIIVAAVILLLHGFIPEKVWSNVDITSQFHKVPQGGSPVKKNTQLGSAFTLAVIFLAPAIGIAMYATNEVQESTALVPPKRDLFSTKLRISITLPLGDPHGDPSEAYCGKEASISLAPQSLQGIECAQLLPTGSTRCEVVYQNCTFTKPSAKLTFTVPWNERYVKWNVSVDSPFEATEHSVSGDVTSGSAFHVINPESEVVVAMLAQMSLLNDTTNAKVTKGFELTTLACTPPRAYDANDGYLTSNAMTWNLTIEMRVSQSVFERRRYRKQDPLTLGMGIFTAIFSMIGIWKTIFSHVEGPVSTVRDCCTRACKMRKERQDDSDSKTIELNTQGAALLIE
jgi:hypothetical protein